MARCDLKGTNRENMTVSLGMGKQLQNVTEIGVATLRTWEKGTYGKDFFMQWIMQKMIMNM